MSVAQRIAAKRAEKSREFMDVEAWGEGETPLRLFFTEVSARDIEKVQRKHPNFLSDTSMSAMVEMIVAKCEDEAGVKVFTLEDKPILLNETVSTIAKVFGGIFSAESAEDHVKN
tara:strand:- start:41 stop:385 length:345 start_codon:yes stop_codon:yes gene_type:complete